MAVRIRTGFTLKGKERSPAELGSVVAALGWKLAVDSIRRMRDADYDIDVGRSYFDFVCESMVFLAVAADRIAYAELSAEDRVAFTTAVVQHMGRLIDENRGMLMQDIAVGQCRDHFFDLFNRRGEDYAECGFDPATGPDFGFRRVFAACLQEILPAKDRLWAIDQVMDIEVPAAVDALTRTLNGLFHPQAESRRRRDGGERGE